MTSKLDVFSKRSTFGRAAGPAKSSTSRRRGAEPAERVVGVVGVGFKRIGAGHYCRISVLAVFFKGFILVLCCPFSLGGFLIGKR